MIDFIFIIAGISRIVQKWVLQKDRFMNAAVAYGVLYVVMGVGLILHLRLATLILLTISPILPILGIGGGLYRYFKYQRKPMILFHVALDILLLILIIIFFANAYFFEHTNSVPIIVQ